MNRSIALIVATAVLAANVTHAHAEAPITQRITVRAAGLDLQTVAGADLMLQRLDRAAVLACGDRPPIVPLDARRTSGFEACRLSAKERAVADLGAPLVARRMDFRDEKTRRLAMR